MSDGAIVEALKGTSLPQGSTVMPKSIVCVHFGPRRAHQNQRTRAFLVGRPDRTPSPQDLQLETHPQDAMAGNPVIAAHLPLRAPLSAAGCFGCPLPVRLFSHLRNSQSSQKRLPGLRSGAAGLSE